MALENCHFAGVIFVAPSRCEPCGAPRKKFRHCIHKILQSSACWCSWTH